MKIKKPVVCKIGFRNFAIKYKPIVRNGKDQILYGQIHHDRHEIEISTQFNNELNKNTLVHEVLHGIEVHYMGQDTFTEKQIEILANGVMDFIRSNKNVIKWIMEE